MILDWEKYLNCVKHFLSVSDSIDDGWFGVETQDCKKLPGNYYLYKKSASEVPTTTINNTFMFEEENMLEGQLDILSWRDKSQYTSEKIIWEYNILYSPSYSVPVLYFNIRNTSGKLLSLDKVWTLLNIPEEMLSEKWNFVSQQEHPILMKPFFYVHPCRTSEFMKINEQSTVNPLVTWLSSIAHIVHLYIPIDYGKQSFEERLH